MLRATRVAHAASPARVQHRLFTGALFTEELNNALCAFAQRHGLRSVVWVPHKAFDMAALQQYHVYVLPTAKLCDVVLSDSSAAADAAFALGSARVLVNADDTSNVRLIEHFRTLLMPATPAALARVFASTPHSPHHHRHRHRRHDREDKAHTTAGANGGADADAALSLPCHYPLSASGAPVGSAALVRQLLERQRRAGYMSNYWLRLLPCRNGGHYEHGLCGSNVDGDDDDEHKSSSSATMARGTRAHRPYINATALPFAGRYNPCACVHYYPHTYTGLPFPREVSALMRHYAVQHGYVSRTWLTWHEATQRFGTRLRRTHACHAGEAAPAVVYTTHFVGGLAPAVAYYCADAFEDSARLFASTRELRLATSGVPVRTSVLRAFPLLRSVYTPPPTTAITTTATTMRGDGDVVDDAHTQMTTTTHLPPCDDRAGADVDMADAQRHLRFAALTRPYDALSLFGVDDATRTQRLLDTGLGDTLRQQCILRHFASPLFITARSLIRYGLAPRAHEYGVPHVRAPTRLWATHAFLAGDCWYNATQLREPAVVHELATRHPVNLLTDMRLTCELSTSCARLQCAHAQRFATPMWLSSYALATAGWRLRHGAVGVPYIARNAHLRRRVKVLYNVADVHLSEHDVALLRHHRPVSEQGRAFVRSMRLAMKLRAYERGYTSPKWIVIRDASAADGGASRSLGHLLRRLSQCMRAHASAITPCRADIVQTLPPVPPFTVPPFVHIGRRVCVNEQEMTPTLRRALEQHTRHAATARDATTWHDDSDDDDSDDDDECSYDDEDMDSDEDNTLTSC